LAGFGRWQAIVRGWGVERTRRLPVATWSKVGFSARLAGTPTDHAARIARRDRRRDKPAGRTRCFAPSVPKQRSSHRRFVMVILRLTRGGANKRPFYHVVATDSRNRRDGRFIERVGFYNPVAAGSEEALRIAMDRVSYWQGVGAQMSPAVARLVKDFAKKQGQVTAPAAA
jgi:small subunit ribosomal protein S16